MFELKKFIILANLGSSLDTMEVGYMESSGLMDQHMVEGGGLHLKQAKSTPRPAQMKDPCGFVTQGSGLVSSGPAGVGSCAKSIGYSSERVIMVVAPD